MTKPPAPSGTCPATYDPVGAHFVQGFAHDLFHDRQPFVAVCGGVELVRFLAELPCVNGASGGSSLGPGRVEECTIDALKRPETGQPVTYRLVVMLQGADAQRLIGFEELERWQ